MDTIENTQTRWKESSRRYTADVKTTLFNQREIDVWKDIIYENIPKDKKLKILDIGTGPGFFSCILSMDGHDVTGIDCTELMLEGAKSNAELYGVSPQFYLMDAHSTTFQDNSFDLIISRNVTWTLYDPVKAYTEWKRILKPGGRLLFFDANWYMNFFDEETKQKFDNGLSIYREKYGEFRKGFSMYLIEDYWRKLPLPGVWRPQWDKATLWKLGFTNIKTECNLDERLYTEEKSKLLYGATPMFMVSADKPENSKDQLYQYWNSVAWEWSKDCINDFNSPKRQKYKDLLKQYIKEDHKKALDIGTGSGFIAMVLADMGMDVTGIDLCSDMINQARYCASQLNLDLTFSVSDANSLPFPDESFDIIICQNVTWTLEKPFEALNEWYRVLNKGGQLIYLDANWNLYLYDKDAKYAFDKNREKASKMGQEKLYGTGHSSTEMIDRLSYDLPLSKVKRPEWDLSILPSIGFNAITCKEDVSRILYDENEILRTESTPMFLISAEKYR